MHRKKFPVSGTNFLWQEEISCHRKKFSLTGQNFKSQKKISCCWMIFPVTGQNFLSQESISCHRKKIAVTGRIFISKDMISYNSQKFPYTRKNFQGMWLVVIFIIISTYNPQHFFRADTPKCAYVILETKMSKITYNLSFCELSKFTLSRVKFWWWKKSCQKARNIIPPWTCNP